MAAYKDMNVSIKADKLEMSRQLKAGDRLSDGNLTMEVSTNDFKIMTITILVTDRVVEGTESITTPAGTYPCYKIKQKVISRFGVTMETNSIEWYCEGTGLIKSESYSNDGKLTSRTELIELKR